jgi:flagellar FliJ protein
LRQHAETQAMEALAREVAAREVCQAELVRADSALESARTATADVQRPVSGAELVARQAYVERREQERIAAQLVAEAQDRRLATQRGEYEAAAVARAALDRLKDRRRGVHARDAARADQTDLSELVLGRHNRTAKGSA